MIADEPVTHIRLDRSRVAWIDDTRIKVVEIVLDHITYGYSPEEIHLQYPGLSLAQVYAAFSYYYDHQSDLDAELRQRYRRVDALRQKMQQPFKRKKLKSRLKRP